MNKNIFNPLKVWASTLSLLAGSPLVYAQEAQVAEEEVLVRGFRSVVMQSQAMKKENASISESITAEDIGKLPDTSIAESLARLPGLAGERRDGRTSGLSVRGFSENYVGTTLNGRELLGMGDNRGVEYDLYPAEIISSVVVSKTPDATLTTQGIGGTVDLRTAKPLDAPSVISINGSFEKNGKESSNPDFDDKGHRLAFTFVDQFADDKFGIAFSVASMESPSHEDQFRAWGYAAVDPQKIEDGTVTASPGVDLKGGESILGGHDSFVRSALMKRDSVAGVLEFAPTDALRISVDGLYIDFEEDKVFRGLEEGGAEWGTGTYNVNAIEDGLVTSGSWQNFRSVIRNDAERKTAELTTFGANIEYDFSDAWTLGFDLSSGKVTKKILNVESYSGVGRAQSATQGAAAARSWEMTSTGVMYSAHPTITTPDYTDRSLVKLAGPQGWGGALAPVDKYQANPPSQPLGPDTAQDGFVNNPDFDETLNAGRLDLVGELEFSIFSGVEVGLNYANREKTKVNNGAFLTTSEWPGDGTIPSQYDLGNADLSFLGLGEIIAYDSIGMYLDGVYDQTSAASLETGRLGDTYKVEETITTLYGMLNMETELGSVLMTGNVGVQVIDTDQSSSGYETFIDADRYVSATAVSSGTSFTKALPSLNLSFEVSENHIIRTALSKTISRPRMDDLRPNRQVEFKFNKANVAEVSDPDNSAWAGSQGNAELRPLEANQFDLGYEWYFVDDGLLGATFFYKDLVNWHRGSSEVQDFSRFYIDGYHQVKDEESGEVIKPTLFDGVASSREDGLTGEVKGIEVQASFPFHVVSDKLDGLGLIVSGTYTKGELDDEENPLVPGLSERVYQLTAYYEIAGFEARISGRKRSEYLSETRGKSLSLTPTIDAGSELWDAQIGYSFDQTGIRGLEGLSITLQAQNITDEDTVQSSETDNREVTRYQNFGPNYLLGVNYKF